MAGPLNIPAHTRCQNCGECCTLIPAFAPELDEIIAFLDKHADAKRFARSHSKKLMSCPFRNHDERRCMIYPVRPVVCRLQGVTSGMVCMHGNTHNIDGDPFIFPLQRGPVYILNQIDW